MNAATTGKRDKKTARNAAANPAIADRQGRLLHCIDQAALALCAFVVLLPDLHELAHYVSACLSVQWRQLWTRLHQACWQRLAFR